MGITDILKFVQENGPSTSIIVILLFVIAYIVKTKWVNNAVSKLMDKIIESLFKRKDPENNNAHQEISESNIINHDIFNYIDFWLYSRIPTLTFSSEYRTVVFRKYLHIYLIKYKEDIYEFIRSAAYKSMDDSELRKALLSLINNIIHDYEKEMIKIGIPDIIVERMKAKNNVSLTLTIDLIENICDNKFYDSDQNYLKIYSILNILLSILDNTVSNSVPVCNSINGQLKGLSMDGKTE